MIPETILQTSRTNFAKKQLRKSNSMNPLEMINKLKTINA